MGRAKALAAAIVFAGITCVRGAAAAPAQSPCTSQTASKLTPQERIAQRDIQAAIDQQIEELAAKDMDAATLVNAKRFLDSPGRWNHPQPRPNHCRHASGKNSVLRVDIDLATLTSSVCISLARKPSSTQNNNMSAPSPTSKNGSPHEIITSVRHREIWTYTENGWVTKRIEELEQGQTYLRQRATHRCGHARLNTGYFTP